MFNRRKFLTALLAVPSVAIADQIIPKGTENLFIWCETRPYYTLVFYDIIKGKISKEPRIVTIPARPTNEGFQGTYIEDTVHMTNLRLMISTNGKKKSVDIMLLKDDSITVVEDFFKHSSM